MSCWLVPSAVVPVITDAPGLKVGACLSQRAKQGSADEALNKCILLRLAWCDVSTSGSPNWSVRFIAQTLKDDFREHGSGEERRPQVVLRRQGSLATAEVDTCKLQSAPYLVRPHIDEGGDTIPRPHDPEPENSILVMLPIVFSSGFHHTYITRKSLLVSASPKPRVANCVAVEAPIPSAS